MRISSGAMIEVATLANLFYGVAITLGAGILLRHLLNESRRRYPPGPPGWPIVGNLLRVIGVSRPKLLFTEWKDTFGDLVYIHGLGNSILIVNTFEGVKTLLEKRGANYSHRPILTVLGELMGVNSSPVLMPYSDMWKFHRKLYHHALGPHAIKKYYRLEEDIAAMMCDEFMDDPQGFCGHMQLAIGRLLLGVAYGIPIKTADDEYIKDTELLMKLVDRGFAPGTYAADAFPILKYLPSWVPFQREAKAAKLMVAKQMKKPFMHVKREMDAGTAPHSFTSDLLSNFTYKAFNKTQEDFEEAVKWNAGTQYSAGANTTYTVMITALLAMLMYPEKRRLAQEEIDRIVGGERLPTIQDRDSLPYVGAFIKESMRWRIAVPLNLPRRSGEEDELNGYYIPAGTTIFCNNWSFSRNPETISSPDIFEPERFLGPDPPIDPSLYGFGFGRRACPGKAMAEDALFIMIVCILAVFDVTPAVDASGTEVMYKLPYEDGAPIFPMRFECTIKPRSAEKATQVQERVGRIDAVFWHMDETC